MYTETANDRFKQRFGRWMWCGVMVAAVFHFALFQFFPELTAEDLVRETDWIEDINLLKDIDIPPPPEPIERPKVPVVGDVDVDENITIPKTPWEENPIPPPLPNGLGAGSGHEAFVAYTVPPRLKSKRSAQRVVEDHYPPLLKDAGVGGEVTLQAYVDRTGRVLDARVLSSSGIQQLDEAALEAVRLFEFTSALNRDTKVAVWIQQLIIFEIN
jgi:protein TonB